MFGRAKMSEHKGMLASLPDAVGEGRGLTKRAAVTDSSQRSSRNSSSAIDSLLTLIMMWHSCGRKNSMSS